MILKSIVFGVLIHAVLFADAVFENAPGIAMDYKIHIDAGKEDCYYQYVHPGSTLYVAFQVLRGGDGQAGNKLLNYYQSIYAKICNNK